MGRSQQDCYGILLSICFVIRFSYVNAKIAKRERHLYDLKPPQRCLQAQGRSEGTVSFHPTVASQSLVSGWLYPLQSISASFVTSCKISLPRLTSRIRGLTFTL